MRRGSVPLLFVLTATAVAAGRSPDVTTPAAAGPVAVAGHGLPNSVLRRRPLPFYYDLYTFRGPSAGSTAVIAAFAVPVNRLEREHHDGGVRYRFDVSFVLADTAQRTVRRAMDSMYVAVPHALSGEHLLYTQIQLLAPPSASTLQRVVMTDVTKPGIGQLYTTPFTIPDYSGTDLMISDIALGVPDETGGWKRGDVRLALLPTSQFPGGSFDLYYEIYNLPRDHQYETEVTVEALDDTGKPQDDVAPVVTRFSAVAETRPDGILPELRRVDTSMERGRYRLTVTVKDEVTGRSASRSRLLLVRDWAPGVTLVPALPAAVRRGSSG
ncbi:MAG: hypothetical protein LJF04_18430 [Gemmatimonadetes bacterium]|nr:hypothetical protein [Gemmatimonadota bacterium]